MKKWFAKVLSLAMAITVVSAFGGNITPAHAEDEYEPTVQKDGITASKYVTVNEDGTYKVTLEAFSTGKVVTKEVPVDIVLVLDVSGSMADSMEGYEALARDNYSYNTVNNDVEGFFYKSGNNYYLVEAIYSNNRYYLAYYSDRYHYLSDYGTGNANSTIYTGVLYRANPSKMKALKDAVNTFVDKVAEKNQGDKQDADKSRIAIVKFAGDKYPNDTYANYNVATNANNWMYNDGGFRYNYTQVIQDFTIVSGNNTNTIKTTVNSLKAGGATSADYGMNYAQGVLNKATQSGSKRQQVVIMFTDGEPNHGSGFNDTVANTTISTAKDIKATKVENQETLIYTIAVYPDANPGADPTASGTPKINRYLHGVSSNFKNATSYTNLGTRTPDTTGDDSFYLAATSAAQLTNIFTSISEGIGGSTLSSEAVMKDIVGSSFTLPKDDEGHTVTGDIEAKVVKWNTTTHDWGSGSGYEYTADQWKNATNPQEDIKIIVDDASSTVDVKGFDYGKHFKTDVSDDPTKDGVNGINVDAAKLVISFDILAKPSSITGDSVNTNGAESGIYNEKNEPVLNFNVPKVEYGTQTYVIDYAKPTTLNYSSVLKTVSRIDNPEDDILKGLQTVNTQTFNEIVAGLGNIDSSYVDASGKITEAGKKYLSEHYYNFESAYKTPHAYVQFNNVFNEQGELAPNQYTLTYIPSTMNWDGYDKLFVMGQPNDGSPSTVESGNVWAMLTVIPANNVYYEDTFSEENDYDIEGGNTSSQEGLNDVHVHYEGIVYSEGDWSEDGSETEELGENANGDVHGWIEAQEDDTQYTGGSAHHAIGAGTATFTFTGTGVDVYSRTNNSTGTIFATLVESEYNEDTKKYEAVDGGVHKALIMSNKALQDNYYVIPTCSFMGLEHGTYTVTIYVTTADEANGRVDYYIDGIRIYNPLSTEHEKETAVKKAYGNELGAVFTKMKDLMAGDKAAYIDEGSDEKEAAKVDYTSTEGKYAPENEIYVAPGKDVTISVNGDGYFYIGMKAPKGETTAELTAGIYDGTNKKTSITVGHSSDMYYRVEKNSSNQIVIKNTGSALLSLTKIRVTTGATKDAASTQAAVTFETVDEESALRAVAEMKTYELVDYNEEVLNFTDDASKERKELQIDVETHDYEPAILPTLPDLSILRTWYQNVFAAFARLFH